MLQMRCTRALRRGLIAEEIFLESRALLFDVVLLLSTSLGEQSCALRRGLIAEHNGILPNGVKAGSRQVK